MSFLAQCACGKSFKVKDEYAGKRGKCPQCGDVVTIPRPSAPVVPASTRPAAPKPSAGSRPTTPKPAARPSGPKPAAARPAPPPKRSSQPEGGFDLDSLGELEATWTVLPDESPTAAGPAAAPPGKAAAKQKACPACGSIISAFARVCEHCGASVAAGAAPVANYATPKKYQAGGDESMTAVDWILCLMCPLIALLVARTREGARRDSMRKVAWIVILIGLALRVIGYVMAPKD
jgi:hypothetical protein